jgi:hypothetical protein
VFIGGNHIGGCDGKMIRAIPFKTFVCLFVCEEETLQKGADSEEIVRTKTTNGRLSEEETFVLSRK